MFLYTIMLALRYNHSIVVGMVTRACGFPRHCKICREEIRWSGVWEEDNKKKRQLENELTKNCQQQKQPEAQLKQRLRLDKSNKRNNELQAAAEMVFITSSLKFSISNYIYIFRNITIVQHRFKRWRIGYKTCKDDKMLYYNWCKNDQ